MTRRPQLTLPLPPRSLVEIVVRAAQVHEDYKAGKASLKQHASVCAEAGEALGAWKDQQVVWL